MLRNRWPIAIALGALLLAALPAAVPPASASLYHFYDGVGDPPPNYPTGGQALGIFNGMWGAQSFAASRSYILTRVALWAADAGSTGDNCTVEVRGDSGGNPNMGGSPLASATTTAGTGYGWVNFTLSPEVPLAAGTIYWVVLKSSVPGNGQGWNWWNTRATTFINPGAGKQSNNQGGSWSNALGQAGAPDFELRTFGYEETNLAIALTVNRARARSLDPLNYTLWFNNTGTEVAATVWINATLSASVAYLGDNASESGGVRTGNYNWTFSSVGPGSHFFVVRTLVRDYLPPGLLVTSRAQLNYTDFNGRSRAGSSAAASTLVNLATKNLHLVRGGGDQLAAAPPTTATVVPVTVAKNAQHDWVQAPALALAFHLRGEATVYLTGDNGAHPAETLNVTLLDANNQGGFTTIGSAQRAVAFDGVAGTWDALAPFTFTGLNYTLAPGHSLVLRLLNLGPDTVTFATNSTAHRARVDAVTDTYVAIGALTVQDQEGRTSSFVYNDTMVIEGNISDPLGAGDIAGALVNITDPAGSVLVASPMSPVATDPSARPSWRLFRYRYSVPYPTPDGIYGVRVTAFETNGVAANRSARPLVENARLTLEKRVDRVDPRQGDVLNYTIYFNNSASGRAPLAWINDTMPPGVAYVADNASGAGGVRTGDYNWTFADVMPGSHFFWIEARVLALVPGGTELVNGAALAYLDPKGNLRGPALGGASSTTRGPRLDIGMAASKPAYNRAEIVRYTVFLNNTGNEAAREATLEVVLPPELVYQSDSAATTGLLASREAQGGRLRLRFANVTVGGHAFAVNASVASGALGGTLLLGAVYGNYTDGASGTYPPVAARAAPALIGPRISLVLRSTRSAVDPGGPLGYLLWVNNTGAYIEAAPDLLLWAYIDNGTDLDAVPPGAVFDGALHRLAWHFTDVPVGYRGLLRWNATAHVGLPPALPLTTTVVGSYTDSAGNQAPPVTAAAGSLVTAPRFSFGGQASVGRIASGTTTVLTIAYTNGGNGVARWVWVNLSVDRRLAYAGQEAEIGTVKVTGERLLWAFANVTPGPHALRVFLLAGTLLVDGAPLNATGSLEYLDGAGHYVAALTLGPIVVTAQAPLLAATLVADRTVVRAGEVVNLTVAVANRGSSGARFLWVNATLDPGLKYLDDDSGQIPYRATDGERERLSWLLPALGPGGTTGFTVKVQVKVGTPPGTLLSDYVSVEYTDALGGGWAAVRSNTVTLALPTAPGLLEVVGPWLPLGAALALGTLALLLGLRPRGRIEEVFLVHGSGLLMAHLSSTLTPDKDRDILASMLTAIQGFVREAFSRSREGDLRSMDFGSHRILIQRGTHAYLAAVARGRSLLGLPRALRTTLEAIEGRYGDLMARWTGEGGALGGVDELLREGLLGRPLLRRLAARRGRPGRGGV